MAIEVKVPVLPESVADALVNPPKLEHGND